MERRRPAPDARPHGRRGDRGEIRRQPPRGARRAARQARAGSGDERLKVYIEAGQKKVFAVAVDWLGLARWATTEDEALETLLQYTARYKKSMGSVAALKDPKSAKDLEVVERVQGNATTDFGAPSAIVDADRRKITDTQLNAATRQLR